MSTYHESVTVALSLTGTQANIHSMQVIIGIIEKKLENLTCKKVEQFEPEFIIYPSIVREIGDSLIFEHKTDLHIQIGTMTGHTYRDIILEQHVCFRGAMGAKFVFMVDNDCPHRANIIKECLQWNSQHSHLT
ncbi:transposable element Tcb2 transposase [Nephila pilipes]|uniref:Transposable element Tcb2 transposase n=1 Tax=Nephila pilipes TaxID=299642 RepID=A0A8X6QUC3_NEPPI|nr:transposable element Tcb2 transposase [Nephila pilipes]